ncbi:MAG: hypothetical protein IJJ82_02450 [Clostridia bacterium]|nr:hypothetical protein [Clostridia bacterium]
MSELEVKKVFIASQGEDSLNYRKFVEIVNKRNTKVQKIKIGERIKLENDLYINVLWPADDKLITQNTLNNNSIVMKLEYKEFSCLFTGDIEKIAEQELLKTLDKNELKSTILKVAHHGSKTSTTQQFLEAVKPKIVLIGVGENNKFGHPNKEVLERLELLRFENL